MSDSDSTEPDPMREFRFELTAGPEHIDEQGHVSNLVFLSWVLEVATAHSTAVGYPHERYVQLGAIFVVRRHEIDYLEPAYEGERIALSTYVGWWRGAACERHTRIARVADDTVLARALTLWAFVAIPEGRPRRIPRPLADAFKAGPPGPARPRRSTSAQAPR